MGQSSSQRKVRHQDIALWELYEDDDQGGGRNRQNRNAQSRNSQGRNVQSRNSQSRNVQGRNSQSRNVQSRNSQSRNVQGRNSQSRNVQNRSSHRSEQSTGANRQSRRDSRSENIDRNSVRNLQSIDISPSRALSSPNTRNGRQVSYIQPYPGGVERRRNPEHIYRGNARPVQSIKRRQARRRRELLCKAIIGLLMAACLVIIYVITGQIYQLLHRDRTDQAETPLPAVAEQVFEDNGKIAPPELMQDFLEINEYSRPGTPLNKINSIFVHYTANPGTSAAQNRSYFSNLAETHERSASAHLIIGYEGELIQCIPFDEQAYAVMTRNEDSISIECCYLSEDGSFTQETYDTLVHTLAWLLDEYHLSTEDILRHYDCGGKLCPLYYAEHEDAWERLRLDVADFMAEAK